MTANTLYYGDNLDILRRYVADESTSLALSRTLVPLFRDVATLGARP